MTESKHKSPKSEVIRNSYSQNNEKEYEEITPATDKIHNLELTDNLASFAIGTQSQLNPILQSGTKKQEKVHPQNTKQYVAARRKKELAHDEPDPSSLLTKDVTTLPYNLDQTLDLTSFAAPDLCPIDNNNEKVTTLDNRMQLMNRKIKSTTPQKNNRAPQPRWITSQSRINIKCRTLHLNQHKYHDILQRLHDLDKIKHYIETGKGIKIEMSEGTLIHLHPNSQHIILHPIEKNCFHSLAHLSKELGIKELDLSEMGNKEDQYRLYKEARKEGIDIEGLSLECAEEYAERYLKELISSPHQKI